MALKNKELGNAGATQTAAAPQFREFLAGAALSFKQINGHAEIMALRQDQINTLLKSSELYNAISKPDELYPEEKVALASNLIALGNDKRFFKLFCDAYGEPHAANLRLLLGDIYNSQVGKAVMEGLTNWRNATRFPSIALGMLKVISTNLSISEDEMQMSFGHFKLPEHTVAITDKTAEGMSLMINAIERKEARPGGALGPFREFCITNPSDAANIFRTKEIREYLYKAMADPEKRKRIGGIFASETGRMALSDALKTPEGINLIGYIFNTKNGRTFLFETVMNQDIVGVFKTARLVIDSQGAFAGKRMPEMF